jgi:hypothetical protein
MCYSLCPSETSRVRPGLRAHVQAVLGGNSSPSKDDITSILGSGEYRCRGVKAEHCGAWGSCMSGRWAGQLAHNEHSGQMSDWAHDKRRLLTPAVHQAVWEVILLWSSRAGVEELQHLQSIDAVGTSDSVISLVLAVGIEAEDDKIELLLKEMDGKDVNDVISEGEHGWHYPYSPGAAQASCCFTAYTDFCFV